MLRWQSAGNARLSNSQRRGSERSKMRKMIKEGKEKKRKRE